MAKDFVNALCCGEVDVGGIPIQLALPWENRMENMGLFSTSEYVKHEKDTR